MTRLRRLLIELWAMLVLAAVVGFLGPFGTYLEAPFPERVLSWWSHLMGAYVLVRPSIIVWAAVADATSLPRKTLVFWGVVLSSFPLTFVWQWGASVFFRALGGFAGILPFASLSSLTVLVVVWWARRADLQLRAAVSGDRTPLVEPVRIPDGGSERTRHDTEKTVSSPAKVGAERSPRLMARLSGSFEGPVAALQSEDHYVRVHGAKGSELLLMRLRDAIAEMDDQFGEQVHRSWWVSAGGIAALEADGRNRTIHLANGETVPVARDSVARLERGGFLDRC